MNQYRMSLGELKDCYSVILIVVPCILIRSKFFCQQMHLLLNMENVKIYIKMSYIRSYMFRSTWTILRELTLSLARVTLL